MNVERDPVHAQAAEWLARLDNPQVSLDETLEWQHWMQTDSRHAVAFARMEEVGKVLQGMERPSVAGRDPARTFRSLAVAATLAAAAIGAFFYLQNSPEVVRTAIGENRSLRLDDQSRVTLGGGTELRISFDNTARRFELTHGEAFFEVAPDKQRPFTVSSGPATVTALGTQFNVRRSSDRIVVAVLEGRVAVGTASLDAGQQVSVNEHGEQTTTPLADIDSAAAWRSGRLTFRGEPLRYVVEDVNRYAAKPVEIADPAIGELQFTGTVLNDNVSGWIASLSSVFGVEVVEEKERIVLQ